MEKTEELNALDELIEMLVRCKNCMRLLIQLTEHSMLKAELSISTTNLSVSLQTLQKLRILIGDSTPPPVLQAPSGELLVRKEETALELCLNNGQKVSQLYQQFLIYSFSAETRALVLRQYQDVCAVLEHMQQLCTQRLSDLNSSEPVLDSLNNPGFPPVLKLMVSN